MDVRGRSQKLVINNCCETLHTGGAIRQPLVPRALDPTDTVGIDTATLRVTLEAIIPPGTKLPFILQREGTAHSWFVYDRRRLFCVERRPGSATNVGIVHGGT